MAQKITALTRQKKNSRRINVYLDGEFAFGLSQFTAAWLIVGQELSEQKIEELLAADQSELAYQRALKFLSYRPRSEAEVRKNLDKHEIDPTLIDATLDRLRRADLVNDRKFAAEWVQNRADFSPRGIRGLRYELRQKNISEEVIDEVVKTIDEEALAYQVAAQKASKIRAMDRDRFYRKISGLLARRGFNGSVVYSTTRRVWDEHHKSSLES